jgi:hypothetical protein
MRDKASVFKIFLGILALLWLPSRVIARVDPAATVKAD